ncbi:MAG: hypothetical protein IJR17_00890 [Clostridia bacterium]|nr:hypothetical protein [Clostridia bacterium]
MKLDNAMAKLICELEYCIGRECYNPNSYDGWTGDEGCEYRYPVFIRAKKNDEKLTKTWGNIAERFPEIEADSIDTMKYKFGSNHLFVGLGIKHLLEELEKRYNIDFNKLEEELHKEA